MSLGTKLDNLHAVVNVNHEKWDEGEELNSDDCMSLGLACDELTCELRKEIGKLERKKAEECKARWIPKVGDVVRIAKTVERYPHVLVRPGTDATGTVTQIEGDMKSPHGTEIYVQLDRYNPGLDEWDNCIIWGPDYYNDFWEDCELFPSGHPYVFRRILSAVREADLLVGQAFASAFPEAESGDESVEDKQRLHSALLSNASSWVKANLP